MNQLQIINGIECFVDDKGIIQLNLENVARGLGFVDKSKEVEYVRWNRVDKYINDAGIKFATCGERPKYIPEPIFYLLSMKAENESAKAFQQKVAYEVLPSIRKHGMYATDELLDNPDLLIQVATALKAEREKNKLLHNENQRMKPKEIFADAVATSHTSILVGDLAKILKQNGVDIGANRLFEWMRNQGFLIKRKGADWNMPTQYSMDLELFEVKESTGVNPDGSVRINKTTKVTGKGQQYFINKLLKQNRKDEETA